MIIAAKEKSKTLVSSSWSEQAKLWNELSGITCVKFADQEDSKEVMNMTFNSMMRTHPKATLHEIFHAYHLVAKGEIEGKIFRQLDFAQMNEFYRAYIAYRNKAITDKNKQGKLYLDESKRTKPTEKEIYDGSLKYGFNQVRDGGFFNPIGNEEFLYSRFYAACDAEGKEKWEDHIKEAEARLKQYKSGFTNSKSGRVAFEKFLQSLKSGDSKEVEDMAKTVAINKMLQYYVEKRKSEK